MMQNTETSYPELLTVSPSPHIKSRDTTRSVMIDVILALLPALAWGIYIFGWRSLVLTILSVLCCMLFEGAYQKLMRKPITVLDGSAAVTGILIAFNVPPTVPLWMPVIGSFFAIVIVKQLYGGIGKNFLNPALSARAFMMLAWPSAMTYFVQPHTPLSPFAVSVDSTDAVASATPLAALKTGLLPESSLSELFVGNIGGCIGELSALLLIAGGLYLLWRKVITWHIPVAFLGTVALLTFFLPPMEVPSINEYMLAELCSGGLMLGAIFMATDYATSPVTPNGRLIFGVGCGALTVFIRYFGGYQEGVSFAILIMNTLVWYLDKFTKPKRFGALTKIPEKSPADTSKP